MGELYGVTGLEPITEADYDRMMDEHLNPKRRPFHRVALAGVLCSGLGHPHPHGPVVRGEGTAHDARGCLHLADPLAGIETLGHHGGHVAGGKPTNLGQHQLAVRLRDGA